MQSQQEKDLLDVGKLPFAVRHPLKTYWAGILSPAIGLVLEGIGLKGAFIFSGVVVGIIGINFGFAAKRCGNLATHTSDVVRETDLKRSENNQAIMNAQGLIRDSIRSGNTKNMQKLKVTIERCEARTADFEGIIRDTKELSQKFNGYENDLSIQAKVLGITSLTITSLGGAYLLI